VLSTPQASQSRTDNQDTEWAVTPTRQEPEAYDKWYHSHFKNTATADTWRKEKDFIADFERRHRLVRKPTEQLTKEQAQEEQQAILRKYGCPRVTRPVERWPTPERFKVGRAPDSEREVVSTDPDEIDRDVVTELANDEFESSPPPSNVTQSTQVPVTPVVPEEVPTSPQVSSFFGDYTIVWNPVTGRHEWTMTSRGAPEGM